MHLDGELKVLRDVISLVDVARKFFLILDQEVLEETGCDD